MFSNSKSKPLNLSGITTVQGLYLSQHKYLGIKIDDSLSFITHIKQPVKRNEIETVLFCNLEQS